MISPIGPASFKHRSNVALMLRPGNKSSSKNIIHAKIHVLLVNHLFKYLMNTFATCSYYFFNYYLAAPRPTLVHYRGGSLTHPMLPTCVLHIGPDGHQGHRSEVGPLSPAGRLVGFEPEPSDSDHYALTHQALLPQVTLSLFLNCLKTIKY